MMTKEILYEAFCKAIAILVPQAENPVNGDVEESYRTGLQGILTSIYNRGIQDAVDVMTIEGLTPDEHGFYFPADLGSEYPIVTLNKEEILKLKV